MAIQFFKNNIIVLHLSGPYADFLKGGLHGGVAQTGVLWALAHSHLGGVWGHAPPENFGNLDSLRVILRHSDSGLQLWAHAASY